MRKARKSEENLCLDNRTMKERQARDTTSAFTFSFITHTNFWPEKDLTHNGTDVIQPACLKVTLGW